jgi:hypothetical protein
MIHENSAPGKCTLVGDHRDNEASARAASPRDLELR